MDSALVSPIQQAEGSAENGMLNHRSLRSSREEEEGKDVLQGVSAGLGAFSLLPRGSLPPPLTADGPCAKHVPHMSPPHSCQVGVPASQVRIGGPEVRGTAPGVRLGNEWPAPAAPRPPLLPTLTLSAHWPRDPASPRPLLSWGWPPAPAPHWVTPETPWGSSHSPHSSSDDWRPLVPRPCGDPARRRHLSVPAVTLAHRPQIHVGTTAAQVTTGAGPLGRCTGDEGSGATRPVARTSR